MPVSSGVKNIGLSTSEEKLSVNGRPAQATAADEPRVFVFVEKPPQDSLGLYLVPFEEEPLTGLFVKTVVPGKPAARLSVFEPGDKIVTVNGKSLRGLSYKESTDFIRQCSGPNVKMGIIKHALYTKEDLDKLASMSEFQRLSGDYENESPSITPEGAFSLHQKTPEIDVHPSAARLAGSGPKINLHGNIDGDGPSGEVAIEASKIIQRSDVSFNVESLPSADFLVGEGSALSADTNGRSLKDFNTGLDRNVELSGGGNAKDVKTDASLGDGYNVELDAGKFDANLAGKTDFNPNISTVESGAVKGVDIDVDHGLQTELRAPFGFTGDVSTSKERATGTAEALDADSSVGKRTSQDHGGKVSQGCRRSRSNPQLRVRQTMTNQVVESRQPKPSARLSPLENHRSTTGYGYPISDVRERDFAVSAEYHASPLATTTSAFRAGNSCAKASPLVQKPESWNFLKSYLVPLSDQPRPNRACTRSSGMIKSKSLDKLDEIIRNDPILRDDYYGGRPSSKSAQTQTDEVYMKKKPRRKRNDRPRSQILPPTYLQLPSVRWLPDELGRGGSEEKTTPTKPLEPKIEFCWSQNYPQGVHRRKSKQEQAQIVQRWIAEMIEHKRAQELRRQGVKPAGVREKSTKLKKKSRSAPEHSFRRGSDEVEAKRRRASDDDDDDHPPSEREKTPYEIKSTKVSYPKLRHSGSEPSFKPVWSRRTGDENMVSVSTETAAINRSQAVGISPVKDEKISPFLQSRIRTFEQSFQQNNLSTSSVLTDSSLKLVRPLGNSGYNSQPLTNGPTKRLRVSSPDLPLISRLLSENEADSQC